MYNTIWNKKPQRRNNKTLGLMMAKKYNIEYIEPTPLNKIRIGVPRRILRRINNIAKSFENLGKIVGKTILNIHNATKEIKSPRLIKGG